MDDFDLVQFLESLYDMLQEDDGLQLAESFLLLLGDELLEISILAELEEHVEVVSRPGYVVESHDVGMVDLLQYGDLAFDQFQHLRGVLDDLRVTVTVTLIGMVFTATCLLSSSATNPLYTTP
jgi:hypothetical protein